MRYQYNKDLNYIQVDPSKNWGDIISYHVVKHFSKSDKFKPSNVLWFDTFVKQPHKNGKLLAIGSIMNFCKPNDIVWGSGIIDGRSIGSIPKKIYAVRGPLTRKKLIQEGREVPEVYGDPALLFPRIYNPSDITEKKYEFGIIPHYADFQDPNILEILDKLESIGVKVVNITAGVYHFVDQLLSCKNIISSSLHGLIAADAYDIPNVRCVLGSNVTGGDFKYEDYYQSINRSHNMVSLNKYTDISLETLRGFNYNTGYDLDLDLLLESGPWNDTECEYF